MLFGLVCFSFLALATAAPANDAQSRDNDRAPTCAERFTTAPDLLIRHMTYGATGRYNGMYPGAHDIYAVNIKFQVTNVANATEWSCYIADGAEWAYPYPSSPDQNVMDPKAVVDECYSREDPDTRLGWWHPPRPRRATWFSLDKEANTLVVGQTVHCVDEDGHRSTYEIEGKTELPLNCTFKEEQLITYYTCDPIDTATISTHFV